MYSNTSATPLSGTHTYIPTQTRTLAEVNCLKDHTHNNNSPHFDLHHGHFQHSHSQLHLYSPLRRHPIHFDRMFDRLDLSIQLDVIYAMKSCISQFRLKLSRHILSNPIQSSPIQSDPIQVNPIKTIQFNTTQCNAMQFNSSSVQ